ncbi:MAG TPA: hypothetical protein VGD43_11920 [Micromonospora sp.]
MRTGILTRLRTAALLLAASLLTSLGLVSVAAPASAGPIGACTQLRSFTLVFQTGGDDLRGNSEVIPWLTTTSGDVELQHVGGGFAGWSTNVRTVTYYNTNWSVSSCSVTGVKLRMISHPEWYETPDNWNMDGFALYGYSSTGSYSYYVSATGSPLKRFTNTDQWWSKLG